MEEDATQRANIQANNVKKGMTIYLRGEPCSVREVTFSKPGKTGSKKAWFMGNSLLSGKKYEDVVPLSSFVSLARCVYRSATVSEHSLRSKLKISPEQRKEIQSLLGLTASVEEMMELHLNYEEDSQMHNALQ